MARTRILATKSTSQGPAPPFTNSAASTTCPLVFTGLVEEKGALLARRAVGASATVHVRTSLDGLALGDSVAVDGACLTVTKLTKEGFKADVSGETLARTTLGSLPIGAPVNLERSLTLSARIGGHLVSGHVDGVCTLTSRVPEGRATCLTFEFAPALARFIAEKGSVTVNGVSLTVNAARARTFDVMIIPHTADVTSLGAIAVGQAVNLEVDLLARYVARLLEAGSQAARTADAHDAKDGAWMDRLKRNGML
jgi:riboflavin synthase